MTLAAVECQHCGARLRLEGVRTAKCPYCASPQVVERPPTADAPNPSFALAFGLGQDAAVSAAERWKRSRGLFTHSGVRRAPIADLRGVYLPAYLYGAVAHATFSVNVGEHYTETETYSEMEDGKWVTKERTVTKTEWRPLEGRFSDYVRDVVVTASRSVPNLALEAIEPFDLRALRRYAPRVVQGWICEEPSTTLAESAELARREAVDAIGGALARFMPGDTHEGLRYTTTIENEFFDLVLLPVWVLAVRHDPKAPPVRLLVNGQTGAIYGRAPISVWKVVLAVTLGVATIAAVVLAVVWGGRS